MPDQTKITITPGEPGSGAATFPTVGCTNTQLVFWFNNDVNAHQPVFSDSNISVPQINPSQTSNPAQPGRTLKDNGLVLPQGQIIQVQYTCALHSGEQGIIQVVNDFYIPSVQLTLSAGKPVTSPLTTGGMPPITSSQTDGQLPSGLVLDTTDQIQGPVLKGRAPGTPQTFTFSVKATDALGNELDPTFVVTISTAAQASK